MPARSSNVQPSTSTALPAGYLPPKLVWKTNMAWSMAWLTGIVGCASVGARHVMLANAADRSPYVATHSPYLMRVSHGRVMGGHRRAVGESSAGHQRVIGESSAGHG